MDIVVAVTRGFSPRASFTFKHGEAVAPFALGAQAEWLVVAPDVANMHVRLAFDGRELRAACVNPQNPAYLEGEPLDERWRTVAVPARLRFGQAELSVNASDGVNAEAPQQPRLPSYFVDMVQARGRAVRDEATAHAPPPRRSGIPSWLLVLVLCAPFALAAAWFFVARARRSASATPRVARSAMLASAPSVTVPSARHAPLDTRRAPDDITAPALVPAPPSIVPVDPPTALAALPSEALVATPAIANGGHAYPQNVADRPIPRIGAHPWEISDEWRAHHERLRDAKNRTDAKVVFLGDSITEAWRLAPAYQTSFGRYAPLDLGIAGDLTQNLLWRIDQGELDGIKPKAAVIMIGVNNLAGGFSAEQTASGVRAIVGAVRSRLPETFVLLLEVLPAHHDPTDALRSKISDCNRLLEELADPGHVIVRDFGPLMLESDGTITKDTMRDFLHPTPAGFERLSAAVAPLLEPILADNAAPSAAP